MLILLVDDNNVSVSAICDYLKLDGCQVEVASSGEQVLRRADRPPDAIVLDYNLPDMSGLHLLGALREFPQWKKVPVVFLTADAGIHLPVGPIGPYGGPFVLLLKPAQIEHLYAALRSLGVDSPSLPIPVPVGTTTPPPPPPPIE